MILYVWPLFPSLIRVDDPYASFDAQKYSLSAKLILETGRGLGHWLSAGIDNYLVFIYRNFGVNEVNVIAFNCIIFLASIKLLSGVFKENTYIPSSLIILLATPLTTFYVIQPSKEVLSLFAVSLFLSIESRKRLLKLPSYLLLMTGAIVVAGYLRLNLAILLMIFLVVSNLRIDRRIFFRLPFVVFFLVLSGYFLDIASRSLIGFGLEYWFEQADTLADAAGRLENATRDNQSEGGISYKIKKYLSPDNIFLSILFLPLKAFLVWVSPFPLISFEFGIRGTSTDALQGASSTLASASGLFNFIVLPFVARMLIDFSKLPQEERLVLGFVIFYLSFIAFVYPTQFTRHRVLIEVAVYICVLNHCHRAGSVVIYSLAGLGATLLILLTSINLISDLT